jgi:DEAD/DEAH box helicase domain-containing protein
VASLLLMCDPRDLGVALTEQISVEAGGFEPNLHIYDNFPGGIGQSAPLYGLTAELIAGTRALISQCACESGCPGCTGPAGETGERGKQSALEILNVLAGVGPGAGEPLEPTPS